MLVRGILTTMSGSLGGITAARNKGGQYLRARVVPVNPQTPQQVTLRTIFAALAVHWGTTLTAAQRTAWDTYAENVTVVNRIGETVNLTGFQMFIRSNTPRLQAGEARVDDGPTVFNLGGFTDVSIAIVGGTSDVAVTFDNTDEWANETGASMIILTSREKAESIEFFKGPYRLAGTIDGDDSVAPVSPATVGSDFSYAAGNKGFAQVRVSRLDGRLSVPQRVFALAS